MKKYLSIIMLVPLFSFAQTGRTIMGPDTVGQPSYPNSGQLRNRSNDMTGSDMSNATHMGSDVDTSVPTRRPQAQAVKPETQTGPYRDRYIFHDEEGPDGIEAQEAAKDGSFEITQEEIERKQRGE